MSTNVLHQLHQELWKFADSLSASSTVCIHYFSMLAISEWTLFPGYGPYLKLLYPRTGWAAEVQERLQVGERTSRHGSRYFHPGGNFAVSCPEGKVRSVLQCYFCLALSNLLLTRGQTPALALSTRSVWGLGVPARALRPFPLPTDHKHNLVLPREVVSVVEGCTQEPQDHSVTFWYTCSGGGQGEQWD